MSQFSGKCDVCDFFGDYTDEQLQKLSFYILADDRKFKLSITNQKDLALYYPNLVMMFVNNEAFITTRPYFEEQQDNLIDIATKLCMYYVRRNKELTDFEPYYYKIIYSFCKETYTKNKAKWLRLLSAKTNEYLQNHDMVLINSYYRNEWYKELINLGYDANFAEKWVDLKKGDDYKW